MRLRPARFASYSNDRNDPSRLAAALTALGAPPASFVVTNAGHSAMERDTALALTAIMDGLARI